MHATTGISPEQLNHLVKKVTDLYDAHTIVVGTRSLPRAFDRVHIVLSFFRLNLSQQALAEFFSISQATVSRLVSILGHYISDILAAYTPNVRDV